MSPVSARRRRRLDRGFGLLIRIASLLVLLSVLGVFAQMAMVARPLFVDRGLEAAAAPSSPVPRSYVTDQPEWVPKHLKTAAFDTTARHRIWIGLNRRGELEGARGEISNPSNDLWQYQPLVLPKISFTEPGLHLLIDPSWRWLAIITQAGSYQLLPLEAQQAPSVARSLPVAGGDTQYPVLQRGLAEHSGLTVMPGGRSFLTWDTFHIRQWHWLPAARGEAPDIVLLRQLMIDSAIQQVAPAPAGQRVAIITEAPMLMVWHTTTHRLIDARRLEGIPRDVDWRSENRLSVEFAGRRSDWQLGESDGAVSLASLLAPIHYEGYSAPSYRWLPVAAADAEPKFGLVPLLWGTVKAALVALLFAIPVGVGAAIFVGFFMSPRLRDTAKPALELLAAFPSVVLGALTALLVAPHFIAWLPGILGAAIAIPMGVLILAVSWRSTVATTARRQVVGWLPILLMPVVVLLAWIGFMLGESLSAGLPGGSLVSWLEAQHGVSVVHRNALLIGLAMGVATVPLVFSIAEDAIHSVPAVLAAGSLALGATHWQSYRDVVLPVAAPGIIAACMIGFGRAVGETMIVLLVASNTPLMDVNLLEGLRSVSATLALELSEAPFESVHYRVLFAAGLALFLLTFILNSLAEIVRLKSRRHQEERR